MSEVFDGPEGRETAAEVATSLRDMVFQVLRLEEASSHIEIPAEYSLPGVTLHCKILGHRSFRELAEKFIDAGKGQVFSVYSVAWALVLCIVDSAGEPIFQVADIPSLAGDEMRGEALQKMARFVYHVNSILTDDAIAKAMAKNSEPTPS